jgi:cysteine-rich repeat protein
MAPLEECDDGNDVDGDGCDSNCTQTACDNGIVTVGETCDDGNGVNGDACDSNCKPPGCGNGATGGTETCDDGNLADGDGCDSNCTLTGCGNGILTQGEACDDGNVLSGDGCNLLCVNEYDEVEPNNSATEANLHTTGFFGRIASPTDVDWTYRGNVLAGTTLTAQTFDVGDGSCATGSTDTRLEIVGPDGATVLAVNENGPLGYCSKVTAITVSDGPHYFVVRAGIAVQPGASFNYVLVSNP